MSLPTTKQVLQKLLSLVLSPSTCSHSSVASGSKMAHLWLTAFGLLDA